MNISSGEKSQTLNVINKVMITSANPNAHEAHFPTPTKNQLAIII